MILVWVGSWALAEDVPFDLAFEPPSQLQLFTQADVVEVRGAVKGGDCAGAVSAALADAATHGTVVRIVESADDLTAVRSTPCKQRRAGDDISASTVDLVAVVVEPGFPPSIFPKVTAGRAVEIAAIVGELNGGGISAAEITQVNGEPWVRSPPEIHPELVDSGVRDPNGRAALVYERYVTQWVSRWASDLTTMPELEGAVLEVAVTSEDPTSKKKTRRTELFRFAVPTSVGASFFKGGLTDDAFVVAISVERANDPKKRDFQRFPLEIGRPASRWRPSVLRTVGRSTSPTGTSKGSKTNDRPPSSAGAMIVEDPGPPPEGGLVVRPQGDGFYARISPRPVPPLRRWMPAVGAFTGIGVILGFVLGDGGWLTVEIVFSIVLFGTLLLGFSIGAGFFPVEIVVDDTTVSWGGERIPMHLVGDCRLEDRTLELVSKDDRVLARIEGVPRPAGRWVSLAIRASLP